MAERGPDTDTDPAVGQRYYGTAERRHVDALLDLSEEEFLKELEPHEYHCYSGWEEAVRGWSRVAPLSCILLTQKNQRKLKHKEPDNQTLLPVDSSLTNSSAGVAEHHFESHVIPSIGSKKYSFLNQHAGSCHESALAALQLDAPDWALLNGMPKAPSKLLCKEKLEQKMLSETHLDSYNMCSKYTLSQYRPPKPQKHSHGPFSTVVPIRNFTFLPLVISPYLNPKFNGQLYTGKTPSEGDTLDESGFMFNKKNRTRGTRVEPIANAEFPMNSKYRTCQHDLNLYSAIRVPVSKRYQLPMSTKPDTVHHRAGYSMGPPSSTVGSARMYPSYLFS